MAFTYGSAVNEHTFCTHVEKADTEFDGAFTIINKRFAEQLPPQYTLINREEDLGIPGLRHSKLSYHPAALQHKFTAIHLHPDELGCKELWQSSFGDDDAFIDRFVISYYSRRRMLAVEEDGRIVAMLHLLPFRTELGRTTYIYGVATAAARRRRGLSTRLMTEAMRRIGESGDDAAILIPAEPWLRGYYGRFGFAGEVPVQFLSASGFDFGTGDPALDRAMVWRPGAPQPLPEALTCTYAGKE